MLKVPCAPATRGRGLNAASPASGSVTVSVPPVVKVVSSTVAPVVTPPMTAASASAATEIGTVTGGETAPSLSVAVKSNDVLPLKLAAGTKLSAAAAAVAGIRSPTVTGEPLKNSVPLAGSEPMVKLAMLPSMSVPPNSTGMPAESSLPLAGATIATGGSFAPLTVTVTVLVVPSAEVTVKLSTGRCALVSACTLASALRSV